MPQKQMKLENYAKYVPRDTHRSDGRSPSTGWEGTLRFYGVNPNYNEGEAPRKTAQPKSHEPESTELYDSFEGGTIGYAKTRKEIEASRAKNQQTLKPTAQTFHRVPGESGSVETYVPWEQLEHETRGKTTSRTHMTEWPE